MLSNSQLVILTLIGIFGFAAIFIMGLRLAMRKVRKQSLDLSDYLTVFAVICVLGRSAFAPVVVLWGNNNMAPSHHFTATEIFQREVGSKLTLADRLVYNTYLWTQKSVVLHLYHQLFSVLPVAAGIVKVYWVVLLATYVVVEVVCFVDCQPVQLYWQVMPYPGKCTHATIQLFTFVSLNMTTDVMLLIFPVPWICKLTQYTLKRRLQLIGLFSIGILLIAIAVVRLPVYSQGTSQVRRYTWGSVEQFGAALVANLPTVYGLCRSKAPRNNITMPQPDDPRDGSRFQRSKQPSWISEHGWLASRIWA